MKKIIILVLILISLTGCSPKRSTSEIIKEIMSSKEYIIIDVRTKEEYNMSHIKNAINIPYDKINKNIDIDKDNVIFVYCASGKRSSIAFNKLEKLGYTVYDLGAFASINLPKE